MSYCVSIFMAPTRSLRDAKRTIHDSLAVVFGGGRVGMDVVKHQYNRAGLGQMESDGHTKEDLVKLIDVSMQAAGGRIPPKNVNSLRNSLLKVLDEVD